MSLPRTTFHVGLFSALLLLMAGSPVAATVVVITGNTADGYVEYRPATDAYAVLGLSDQNAHVGNRFISSTDRNQVVVYVFELPARPSNNFVTDASLSFYLSQVNDPDEDVDLLGLRWSASNAILTTDYAAGSTLLQASILDPAMAIGTKTTSATGDANLAAWIDSLYDNGAGAGDFAFLQFKYAGPMPSGVSENYRIDTADNTTASRRPTLTLEFVAIPEPTTTMLMVPGVLLLMRRKRRV